MHARLCAGQLPTDSPDWLDVAERQHLLDGNLGDPDFPLLRARFETARSCVEAGPVTKFARWLSINEAW